MIGLRSVIAISLLLLGFSECLEAGEVALLDELERRAAAGAHVVDSVGEAELGGSAAALSPPPTTVNAA